MISVYLACGAVVAFCCALPVARFSRWRWLSPWLPVCVMTGMGLVVASGASDGHWPVCAAAVVVAAIQARVALLAARARRRITEALAAEAGEAS